MRVLVIDDVEEARDLYRICIEYHGFSAEEAEDGPAGLALALTACPDVVVLDFSMPRMNGAEVLDRLKADPRTCDIPVVMVTSEADLVPLSTRASCAAFLEKPCDPERLLRTLAGVTGRHAPD